MISRRALLRMLGGLSLGVGSLSSYATGIEPFWLVETNYRVTPPGWPKDFKLRLAIVADIHACEPWMTVARIRNIVSQTNALKPDATLLLGDYVVAHKWVSGKVPSRDWAQALAGLRAPLGIHAVMGNHDWWDDAVAQARGHGPTESHRALVTEGIRVYENDAVRLEKNGQPFWLAGLGDQYALRFRGAGGRNTQGVDNLKATLAKVTDDSPVILMAHEPDIFAKVPPRIALTISGHTHGGQVRVMGYVPWTPARHREAYTYGHYRDTTSIRFPSTERNLIVSGGLGCSILPIRFGVPPEIVIIEFGSDTIS